MKKKINSLIEKNYSFFNSTAGKNPEFNVRRDSFVNQTDKLREI